MIAYIFVLIVNLNIALCENASPENFGPFEVHVKTIGICPEVLKKKVVDINYTPHLNDKGFIDSVAGNGSLLEDITNPKVKVNALKLTDKGYEPFKKRTVNLCGYLFFIKALLGIDLKYKMTGDKCLVKTQSHSATLHPNMADKIASKFYYGTYKLETRFYSGDDEIFCSFSEVIVEKSTKKHSM